MKCYLFAYGSMKKDFINHDRLINEKFIGNAITKNKYNMYPDSLYLFPYAIEKEKVQHLKGELYLLENDNIKNIDRFEGVPDFYYRKLIPVICNDVEIKAYIYFRAFSNSNSFENQLPIDSWKKDFENFGVKLSEIFNVIKCDK